MYPNDKKSKNGKLRLLYEGIATILVLQLW